jgi:DNA helicase HerA-like ATPase
LEVTTVTAPSGYPWLLPPPAPAGVPIGYLSGLGRELFCYDPWSFYRAGWLSGPTMLVLGRSGRGKSALIKTYLTRMVGSHPTQALVLDPKHEYDRLATALGLSRIELRPGGPDRLNPLSLNAREGRQSATETARALAELGLRRPLSPAEGMALSRMVDLLPAGAGLADLVALMLDPPPGAGAGLLDDGELKTVARAPGLALAALIEGELAGMFDGTTTINLEPHSAGLVVDLSGAALGDALGAVMVAVAGWLMSVVSAGSVRRRVVILDESWAALRLAEVTRLLQAVAKLGRSRGTQLIVLAHRPSDLAAQADAGSEANAQAQGLAAEAETVVLYAQAAGEAALAGRLFGLTSAETDLLGRLGRGEALWRIGGRSRVVTHLLLAGEIYLVDTDAGMRAR